MGNSQTRECWFLDVGQGSANVILLGGKRAIVIDSGPSSSIQTLQLLRSHVDIIESLIITHNDNDHDGNVARILYAFPKLIRKILFLRDRNPSYIRLHRTLALLNSQERQNYPMPERIEADPKKPKILFKEGDLKLSIMYPTFTDNLDAEDKGTRSHNYTSAIIKLKCGNRRIIFSGDATIEAWESLSRNIKDDKPLLCDIMTVPHHGGNIASDINIEQESQEKLYSEIITPQYAVISVATRNIHKHPIKESILALVKAGARVFCTQMTSKCSIDLETIRSMRRTIIKPARSSHSESRSAGGYSKNVACFGSVVAEISSETVRISNLATFEQDRASFGQVAGFTPICRPLN